MMPDPDDMVAVRRGDLETALAAHTSGRSRTAAWRTRLTDAATGPAMSMPLAAAWEWLLERDHDEHIASTRQRITADPEWLDMRARATAGDVAALDELIAGTALLSLAVTVQGLNDVMRLEQATRPEPPRPRGRRRR